MRQIVQDARPLWVTPDVNPLWRNDLRHGTTFALRVGATARDVRPWNPWHMHGYQVTYDPWQRGAATGVHEP